MSASKTVSISIHVAVDSFGQWFAWGSGCEDQSDFREESIALFNATKPWLNLRDDVGNDEADVEHFTVLAEIPIPEHVVLASAVRPAQKTLFESDVKSLEVEA